MRQFCKRLIVWGGLVMSFGHLMRLALQRFPSTSPFWLGWMLENPCLDQVAGADIVLDRVGLEPGMQVIDVGCGPGRLTILAAERVGPAGEVMALDIDPKMLNQVREKARRRQLENIRYLQAKAEAGQLGSQEFDRAMLVTVLGEIPDREAALAEIFAALKPNGLLSVTEIIPDPHYQSQTTVRRLCQAAGFEEQAYFGNWLAFTINFRKPGQNRPPNGAAH